MAGILQTFVGRTSATSGWSFVAAGSIATGASPTVAMPAGLAANQLLVLFVFSGNQTTTIPGGWTSLLNQNAGSNRNTIAYKVATGSETSLSLTSSSAATKAIICSWSGLNATPADVNGTAGSGSSTTATTNSLTTTAANDLVISYFSSMNGTVETYSGLTGGTQRVNSGADATFGGLYVSDENQVSAGATTARSITLSASANWVTFASSFKL